MVAQFAKRTAGSIEKIIAGAAENFLSVPANYLS
jgi:hypothetical protein